MIYTFIASHLNEYRKNILLNNLKNITYSSKVIISYSSEIGEIDFGDKVFKVFYSQNKKSQFEHLFNIITNFIFERDDIIFFQDDDDISYQNRILVQSQYLSHSNINKSNIEKNEWCNCKMIKIKNNEIIGYTYDFAGLCMKYYLLEECIKDLPLKEKECDKLFIKKVYERKGININDVLYIYNIR